MDFKNVLDLILDTDDVTVGGGSASALAGAKACGLIGMVCKLSTKKRLWPSSGKIARIR